jgi:hypothetical protein
MEFWLLKTSKNNHLILALSNYNIYFWLYVSSPKKKADGQHKNFIFFGPILLEISFTTNMSFSHYPN